MRLAGLCALDAGTGAAPGDDQLAANRGVDVLGVIAAQRDVAGCIAQHDDRQRTAKRRAVGVLRRDRRTAGEAEQRTGETGVRVGRGDRDRAVRRPRRTDDVRRGAFIAGGRDDDDAGLGGIVGGDRIGSVGGAVRRAKRHADHVHAVVHGPVDALRYDVA